VARATSRGDGLVAEASPDAEAVRRRFEHALREVVDTHGAFMGTQATLNAFVHFSRHKRDDPALAAVAVACDRVLNVSGVPDPTPAPLLAEEVVA
jgi:hypothetical protein